MDDTPPSTERLLFLYIFTHAQYLSSFLCDSLRRFIHSEDDVRDVETSQEKCLLKLSFNSINQPYIFVVFTTINAIICFVTMS